jgi:hypothetical protein
MEEMRNAYKRFSQKTGRMSRSKLSWENNMKMDLK